MSGNVTRTVAQQRTLCAESHLHIKYFGIFDYDVFGLGKVGVIFVVDKSVKVVFSTAIKQRGGYSLVFVGAENNHNNLRKLFTMSRILR